MYEILWFLYTAGHYMQWERFQFVVIYAYPSNILESASQ